MKKKNLLIALMNLLFIPAAFAQTWDGSAGTSWNTPANWSTNAVPLITGNVTIPGGLTNYPVLANNVTINSIDMQAGSRLDFNGFSLTITTASAAFTYFIGATLNNSSAGTDIVINITTIPGYHSYLRSSTFNDNITFNIAGPANLYEADNTNTGNHYTGNLNINMTGTGALYLSNGDTCLYDGNLIINRTTAGITDAFNSGAIIGGNFSFTNNTSGNSLFGIISRKTSIGGTVNIAINNTTPGSFELIRVINQTGGGSINVQNPIGFDVRNDTLIVGAFGVTGYRGADFGYLLNNDITGNIIVADDASHVAGYHTYVRANLITGNAAFTINSVTNLYEADNTATGNHYTGNVNFTAAGTGALYLSNGDTCLYDGNLTVTRTAAGITDAFNGGAIIGGNFTFTNNTAGSSLFGILSKRTSIGGTVNISINNASPSSFELIRVINQTGGGNINVQNSIGFDVRNDTLIVGAFGVTGYRGADFGYLLNNDITGNIIVSDDASHVAGYHTYVRANLITGNAAFTINSVTNLYEADNTATGNHYTGNVNFTAAGTGAFYLSNGDTCLYDGNLVITRTAAGITDAFNSGGVIGGNFSFTNNTSGNSLFGIVSRKTSIGGTVNIAINNTVPGSFELMRVVNQTGGGSINVQNPIGFDVRNDTLIVDALSVTGYRGTDFGYLYNNDITGNITLTEDVSHTAGYHTYIRDNLITGNSNFTGNAPSNNIYDADNNGTGNKYRGNVTYTRNGGPITVGTGDTTEFAQNLTLNSASGITLSKIKLNGTTDGAIEQLSTQPVVIPELIMEKTGAGMITLNDSVTVSNSVFFNGGTIVSTTNNKLIFLDNVTYTGASDVSHVNGPLQKNGNDAFIFPTGSGMSLNPVEMTAPAAGSIFSAEYLRKNPDLDGFDTSSRATTLQRISGCEYWDVRRTNGTSNVTLTFSFADPCSGGGLYITDPSKLRIARWTGSIWENLGNGGSTGTLTGTVTTAGPVINFSPFTFATVDVIANPLPVQLVMFTATKKQDAVDLQWKTENELNFSHFEIERSKDGSRFELIGTVTASNTAGPHQYALLDGAPYKGINFYRLKMIDIDGNFTYSKVETILFSSSSVISIYPNPAKDEIKILSSGKIKAIEVMDVSGKLIKKMLVKADNRYNVNDLQSGVYYIRVTDEEKTQVSKLIIR